MVKGAKNWDDTSIRYDQTTKIIERFMADLKKSKQAKFWLESCNVCASSCAVEAVDAQWLNTLPRVKGKKVLSQADFMFDYIYSIAAGIYRYDGICENEVPDNLALAIPALSTAKTKLLRFDSGADSVTAMIKSLQRGCACVLSYLTDYHSGHYVCAVAYDNTTDEIIVYDSWGDNMHCKKHGKQERYSRSFFEKRMRTRYIEVTA